ncbi:MAG: site-specific DNA-methyltransferase [Parvularculales bacterium]
MAVEKKDAPIKQGDCRELLKGLEANSVHLVLTDPPYFLDGLGSDWNDKRIKQSRSKAGVVGGLPVGMKFDSSQGLRLARFLEPVAQEWLRVLKPGGFALCFAQARLSHHAAMAMEGAGFEIRDICAWAYEGQAKAFSQDHFVRRRTDWSEDKKACTLKALGGRKTPQLKPRMELIIVGQKPREGTFVDNWLQYRTGLIDISNPVIETDRMPGTIIPADKPKDRHGHITAKPVALLRHLIRIFSDKGECTLVLDSFAGGGSTGEAALLEGRRFIGFEIEADYVRRANQRIKAVMECTPRKM